MTNEVLLSMLKSNSEEYETLINNDCLENTYRKKYHIKHIFESNDIIAKIKYHKKNCDIIFCKIESRKSFFCPATVQKVRCSCPINFYF